MSNSENSKGLRVHPFVYPVQDLCANCGKASHHGIGNCQNGHKPAYPQGYTCNHCPKEQTCWFAWDYENIDGGCTAE